MNNFSKDVMDGENYTVLLNQLKPDECSRAPLQTRDIKQRAEEVLQNADRIGCRKYLTPSSLVSGNPRLNLAFVANLFNTWPGLAPLEEQEMKDFGAVEDFDAEGERARAESGEVESRPVGSWRSDPGGPKPGNASPPKRLEDSLKREPFTTRLAWRPWEGTDWFWTELKAALS